MKELIEKWKKLAGRMSYFNAAEGSMWGQERADRIRCQAEFKEVSDELGKEVCAKLRSEGNYLI